MPKTYYCWRCRMPIPMLTDAEWAEVHPLLQMDIQRIKAHRTESGLGLSETLSTSRHQPCDRYFEITGFRESNPNAIWHHVLSAYGPECPECGHLFRTSRASFCANCGFRPSDSQ
jgi:hypothetical protein